MSAKLLRLLDGIQCDVPGTGHRHALGVEGFALRLEHLVSEVHQAVTRCFGAHLGASPGDALAGQHARVVTVRDALVLSEQVADFAPAHANVACGNVGVFTDVAVQLSHEGLAETHDFAV